MVSRIGVVALGLLAAAAALAQTTAPSEFPYTGVVAGRDVHVRSGPGEAYYPCATLSGPDVVRVEGRDGTWLKIRPPKVCFSLIAKEFVRVQGNVGTVTGTNVRVRAGSTIVPSRMDRIQTQLNVGDTVLILGEQDEYYRIAPPGGVYLWMAAQYVRREGEEPPLVPPIERSTPPVSTTRTVLMPPEAVDQLAREKAEFEAAERALREEYKKPPEQRDLAALLERYQGIKPAEDSQLAPWVEVRIKFLQNALDLAKDVLSVDEMVRALETERAQRAAERAKIETEIPKVPRRRTYAVEGVLSASGLFRGGATGPKRYVVSDPDKTRIYAYVQCTTNVVNLEEYVGAHVGVVGTPEYDSKSGLYVVEAEQVIVLQPAPPRPALPTRPAPRTQPVATRPGAPVGPPGPGLTVRPKPLPKPEPAPQTQPRPEPAPIPKPGPELQPKPEPKPPTTQPTGSGPPLPPTGLPVVEPTSKPAPASSVDPKEYE